MTQNEYDREIIRLYRKYLCQDVGSDERHKAFRDVVVFEGSHGHKVSEPFSALKKLERLR